MDDRTVDHRRRRRPGLTGANRELTDPASIAPAAGPAGVINVLSIVSFAAMPALGGYSASKAAAYSVTQALRNELAGKRIAVHAAFPGPIDTDMIREMQMPKTSPDDVAASSTRSGSRSHGRSSASSSRWAAAPDAVAA